MWFKLYTNEVFRKREKIAITVVYYKYTTSSDLTILCSFMLHYYSIKGDDCFGMVMCTCTYSSYNC